MAGIQFRSVAAQTGTAASVVANLPTGVANGEIVHIFITLETTGRTITTPSGWTLCGNGDTGTFASYLFKKVWSTGDPTTQTFTFSGSSGYVVEACCHYSDAESPSYNAGSKSAGSLTPAEGVATYTTNCAMIVDNDRDDTVVEFGDVFVWNPHDAHLFFMAVRGTAGLPTVSLNATVASYFGVGTVLTGSSPSVTITCRINRLNYDRLLSADGGATLSTILENVMFSTSINTDAITFRVACSDKNDITAIGGAVFESTTAKVTPKATPRDSSASNLGRASGSQQLVYGGGVSLY